MNCRALIRSACGVPAGAMRPFQFVADIGEAMATGGPVRAVVAQVVLNVVLFVPLGMLARHLFRRGFVVTVLLGVFPSPLLSFALGRSLPSGPPTAADAPARELQRGLVSAAVLDGAVVTCAALALAGAGAWPLLAAFLPLGLLGLSLRGD